MVYAYDFRKKVSELVCGGKQDNLVGSLKTCYKDPEL